jgi:hypothetical protein
MSTTRISTKLIAAVATLISAVAYADGDYKWGESFEKFAGPSGSTVNGAASDSGLFTWSAPSSFTVVKKDGTAYHRKNYLRITDNTSGQHTSTVTFDAGGEIPCPSSPSNDGSGGVPISFAFRRIPLDGAASEAGLNIRFSFKSDDGTKSGDSSDYDLYKSTGLQDSKWYIFQGSALTYHWNKTQTQPCVTRFKILDSETGETVYSLTSGLPRANLTGVFEECKISAVRFMTGSSGQAIIDIDDIRVGNYEYPPVPGLMILAL